MVPALKLPTFKLKARTRHVTSIDVKHEDFHDGYLPLIDAGEEILVGNAAVTNMNGKCHVMSIKVGYGDVNRPGASVFLAHR